MNEFILHPEGRPLSHDEIECNCLKTRILDGYISFYVERSREKKLRFPGRYPEGTLELLPRDISNLKGCSPVFVLDFRAETLRGFMDLIFSDLSSFATGDAERLELIYTVFKRFIGDRLQDMVGFLSDGNGNLLEAGQTQVCLSPVQKKSKIIQDLKLLYEHLFDKIADMEKGADHMYSDMAKGGCWGSDFSCGSCFFKIIKVAIENSKDDVGARMDGLGGLLKEAIEREGKASVKNEKKRQRQKQKAAAALAAKQAATAAAPAAATAMHTALAAEQAVAALAAKQAAAAAAPAAVTAMHTALAAEQAAKEAKEKTDKRKDFRESPTGLQFHEGAATHSVESGDSVEKVDDLLSYLLDVPLCMISGSRTGSHAKTKYLSEVITDIDVSIPCRSDTKFQKIIRRFSDLKPETTVPYDKGSIELYVKRVWSPPMVQGRTKLELMVNHNGYPIMIDATLDNRGSGLACEPEGKKDPASAVGAGCVLQHRSKSDILHFLKELNKATLPYGQSDGVKGGQKQGPSRLYDDLFMCVSPCRTCDHLLEDAQDINVDFKVISFILSIGLKSGEDTKDHFIAFIDALPDRLFPKSDSHGPDDEIEKVKKYYRNVFDRCITLAKELLGNLVGFRNRVAPGANLLLRQRVFKNIQNISSVTVLALLADQLPGVSGDMTQYDKVKVLLQTLQTLQTLQSQKIAGAGVEEFNRATGLNKAELFGNGTEYFHNANHPVPGGAGWPSSCGGGGGVSPGSCNGPEFFCSTQVSHRPLDKKTYALQLSEVEQLRELLKELPNSRSFSDGYRRSLVEARISLDAAIVALRVGELQGKGGYKFYIDEFNQRYDRLKQSKELEASQSGGGAVWTGGGSR